MSYPYVSNERQEYKSYNYGCWFVLHMGEMDGEKKRLNNNWSAEIWYDGEGSIITLRKNINSFIIALFKKVCQGCNVKNCYFVYYKMVYI